MKNYLGQAALWVALAAFFVNLFLALTKKSKQKFWLVIMAIGPLGVAILCAIHLWINYGGFSREELFFGFLGMTLAIIWGVPFLWKALRNG